MGAATKACLALLLAAAISSAAPELTCAYQVPHVPPLALRPESNAAIAKAKTGRDLGGKVQVGVRNTGGEPLVVRDLRWSGRSLADHQTDHSLVWHRMEPAGLPPGQEAMVTLCLRECLLETTELAIDWGNGERSVCEVSPVPPLPRFEGIFFGRGRKQAWLYLSGIRGDARLFRNGREQAARSLSPTAVDGIRVYHVAFGEALERGSTQIFRLHDATGAPALAALRAYDHLGVFGSYGGARYERLAENGLSGYACFGKVGRDALDEGAAMGVRSALTVGREPPADSLGHPGLYAYILMDEPDCKDYGVKDRPMAQRLGAHAPQMLEYAAACHAADPATPTMLTVDLTFTPANYFVYGTVADIANPDCYAITVGWPIQVTRNHAAVVRAAAAPRPFTFTYQSSWEEYAKADRPYVGGAELRAKGWDAFRDNSRKRGFGRPPAVEEVRLGMLYAVGSGAKGLFGYIDTSELCGSLMFHGSEDLPEIWGTVGEMSRCLRAVAPLIEISHPVLHVRPGRERIWARTLLAGEDAALVIAANEDHDSAPEAFSIRPATDLPLVFPDLPWLRGGTVARVVPDGLRILPSRREDGGLTWTDDIHEGAIYAVVRNDEAMDGLRREATAMAEAQARGIAEAKARRVRQSEAEAQREKELLALPPELRLRGTPIHGYGFTDQGFWNPAGEKYNTIDFWEKEGTKALGVEWAVAHAGKGPRDFVWQGRLFGGKAALRVTRAEGEVVMQRALDDVRATRRREERIQFPTDGSYRISILVQPEIPREHGGRIAGVAFLVPAKP